MQLLPARQRAVLVLRDGLGWPATDVADLLGDSVPAVNSVLQRARERIAHERAAGTLARVHAPRSASAEAAAVREFIAAWAAVDIPRIVALLHDDALLTMPPVAMRFEGSRAIGEFFASEPAGGRLERIHHAEVRANGQPALASYIHADGEGRHEAYGVMVLAIQGERIAGITGFPHDLEVFLNLGLPERRAGVRTR